MVYYLPLPLKKTPIVYQFKRIPKDTSSLCSETPPTALMQQWLNPSAGSSLEREEISKLWEHVRTKPMQTSIPMGSRNMLAGVRAEGL